MTESRSFLSRVAAAVRREPVRVYLYGLATAIAGTLIALGHVQADEMSTWIYLISVVLGVEGARQKVTPTAAPRDALGGALVPARPADLGD